MNGNSRRTQRAPFMGGTLRGASRLTTSWSERGMDKMVLLIWRQRVAQLERYTA
jgi:hypothetical protein